MSCDMAASFLYTGGLEQVKQVSESESAKILANWQIYPVFFLAASPEILLFLPPCPEGRVLPLPKYRKT